MLVRGTEQELLQQRDEYIVRSASRRLSQGELRNLNNINETLRAQYDYSRQTAPKLKQNRSGELEAKRGITVVGNAPSYDELEEKTGYKIEENLISSQDALRAEKAVREGTAKTGDVFGGYNPRDVELNKQNIDILRQRALQSERAAKERLASKPSSSQRTPYSPFKPVATSISGETIYAENSNLYVAREVPASNMSILGKSLILTPYEPPRQTVKLPMQIQLARKGAEPIVNYFKYLEGSTEATNRQNISAVQTFKNNPFFMPTLKPSDKITSKDIVRAEREFTVYKGLPGSSLDVQTYAAAKTGLKRFYDVYQLNVLSSPVTKSLTTGIDVGSAFAVTSTKNVPFLGTAVRSVSNVATPFAKSIVQDPVFAYTTVAGPRLFGKTAYKALDYFDVGSSVATGTFTGYTTGGVGGAIAGGSGAYVGERLSDKFAFFAGGKPKLLSSGVSTSYSTTSAQTIIISPQTAFGNGASYTAKYEYKPYIVRGKTTQKMRGGVIAVKSFKQILPSAPKNSRRVETDLVFDTTEPPAPSVVYTSTKYLPSNIAKPGANIKSLFSSKRASFDFAGTQSSEVGNYQGTFTGTNQNFAGTFKSQVEPRININNMKKSSVFARSRSKTRTQPKLSVRAKPLTKSFSQSFSNNFKATKTINIANSFSNRITGTRADARSGTNTVNRYLSQSISISPSLTQTQSQTISPSISQTMTVSISPTVSPTFSLTQTRTRTPTATLTPTLTPTQTFSPTLNKLRSDKRNANPFLKGFKLKGIKTGYTPTAAAALFSLKGSKLTGRLSGLEFRGIAR